MNTFEWVVFFSVLLPVGFVLWLILFLAIANIPAFFRTLRATWKLARMKAIDEQTK